MPLAGTFLFTVMLTEKNIFDVVVIGGGPAGIMAAGKAAEDGASVIIIEKNRKLGRKLLLTGGGRCNITNAEPDIKKLVSAYGENGKFLFRAFSIFGTREVISFFNERKVKTKTERGKRVFPADDKAQSVLRALNTYLKEKEVTMLLSADVHRLSLKDGKIKKVVLKKGGEVYGKNYIIATGGKSYSSTGSSGDGLRWAAKLGHSLTDTSPVLVPLKIKENWIKDLQGLSLKNVKISIKGDKKEKHVGECVFTHFGISGPVILKLSKKIGEIKKRKEEVILSLDLKPGLDEKTLDQRLQKDFKNYTNKDFKNSLKDLLPSKIIPLIVSLSEIDPEKKVNRITKEERKKLVRALKNLEMTVKELMGFSMAIVTSGGVSLSEIDDQTMGSKKIHNLFFAGEVIDVDGITGGFNLQMCWSTGYLAGKGAAKNYEDVKWKSYEN